MSNRRLPKSTLVIAGLTVVMVTVGAVTFPARADNKHRHHWPESSYSDSDHGNRARDDRVPPSHDRGRPQGWMTAPPPYAYGRHPGWMAPPPPHGFARPQGWMPAPLPYARPYAPSWSNHGYPSRYAILTRSRSPGEGSR